MGKSLQIITIALALALAISIATYGQAGFAATAPDVKCVRNSHSSLGFTSVRAFDGWFPKVVCFYRASAQPAERGRLTFGDKSGYYLEEGRRYWHASGLKWEMLPDGRLFAHFPQKGGYVQVGTQRYKCDVTVAEILARR